MSERQTKPLGDLLDGGQVSYGVVQPGTDSAIGVPIVRVKDIRNGLIDTSAPMRVDKEISDRHRRTLLRGGELLLSLVGTVGEAAVVPDALIGWNVARAVAVVRSSEVSSRWLQLCFESRAVKSELESFLNTTVQSTLNLSDLKRIQIPVPPKEVRDAITEVLGALDDKIAANTKLLALLDAHMALEYTLATSRSGRTVKLADVAEFQNRRRVPLSSRERDERPGAVPYYGASGVFGSVDESIFDEPLVLVGEDGSVIRDDGTPVIQYIWGPSWVNNHAHVLIGVGISTELLYQAIGREQVTALVTGAVQPKISMGNLKRLELHIPASGALETIEAIVRAETASKRALVDENRTLAATRDALLPQLMSGKLRVKDAEKVLEGVL